MKKLMIHSIMFLCLISLCYATICETEIQQNEECFMITPVISCSNYTYDIFDSGGFKNESGNLTVYSDGMYYFNFSKSGIDVYRTILCNGQTRDLSVILADTNYTTNFTINTTTPVINDLSFSLSFSNYMDIDKTFPITLAISGNITGYYANITLLNITKSMGLYGSSYISYVRSNVSEDTNFSINVYNSTNNVTNQINGTLKFRSPFYLTIGLFSDRNTTFTTSFDYIYLTDITSTSSSTPYTDFGNSLNSVLTFGLWSGITLDYTEVFWGEVIDNQAIIKMYETGNYSVTLLSMKTFNANGWNYEFYKPQYTNSKVETTIDDSILIQTGIDQTANILLSAYEVNKSGVIFDWIKWAFIIFLFCVGIGLSFVGGVPAQGIGATFLIITALIKLLGLA